jgi:hypothetical protein
MFLETRACGPRSLWVILKSARSLKEHMKESNFNIFSYNHENLQKHTECYREYVQYIRYGSWGQPHPRNRKLLNISKTVEIPTPKPHTGTLLFLFSMSI